MTGRDNARDQRVAVHVQRIGLQSRQAVVVCELVAHVGHLGLDSAARQRSLADDVEVLPILPDVNGQGDHLGAGLLACTHPIPTDVSRPPL